MLIKRSTLETVSLLFDARALAGTLPEQTPGQLGRPVSIKQLPGREPEAIVSKEGALLIEPHRFSPNMF